MNIFDVSPLGIDPPIIVNSFSTVSSAPVEMAGYLFEDFAYTLRAPDAAPPSFEPEAEWAWLIDKGPFYDRFGDAEGYILASTHPVVKAIVESAKVREYLDLRNAKLIKNIQLLQQLVPEVTQAIVDYVLRTPVGLHENRALRIKFFNGEGG